MNDLLDRDGWVKSQCWNLSRVTYRQKVLALAREIRRRRRTYPQVVASGKATQAEVDEETGIMEAILADYWDRYRSLGYADEQAERARRQRSWNAGIDPMTFEDPDAGSRTQAA